MREMEMKRKLSPAVLVYIDIFVSNKFQKTSSGSTNNQHSQQPNQ